MCVYIYIYIHTYVMHLRRNPITPVALPATLALITAPAIVSLAVRGFANLAAVESLTRGTVLQGRFLWTLEPLLLTHSWSKRKGR